MPINALDDVFSGFDNIAPLASRRGNKSCHAALTCAVS
jgi:hypothetical protein